MIVNAVRRLHWLDGLLSVLLVIAIVGSLIGYRALSGTQPKVDALQPATIRPAATTRVRLLGRDLRPFVQVFLIKAGAPFVLHDPGAGYQLATFFLKSAREGEIETPALSSGLYDLYLYDQGQRMAMLPAALRVQADASRPATMAATVRFYVPSEMVRLIRVGDRDQRTPSPAGAAEIRGLTARLGESETVDFRKADRYWFAGPKTRSHAVDATLVVPVTRDEAGAWTYKGAPVRAGEDFTLETTRYVVSGITLDVDIPK